MKEKLKKIVKHKYFPFFVLFITMFILHTFMYSDGDDDFFRVQLDSYNIFDYLIMRYKTWSSRIVVEALFVVVTHLPFIVWCVIDSLALSFMGITISKIFNNQGKQNINWLIVSILLLLPYHDMSSAGYVCTTIAYVWTSTALLYNLYVLKKILNKEKITIWEHFISFICLFLTISFEQTLCLLLGFITLFIIYTIFKKQVDIKKQSPLYLYFIIAILMLVFTLSCPGNNLRSLSEIEYWYPEYAWLSTLSKVYLGLVPMMAVFLKNGVVLAIFSFVLCYSIFKKYNNSILRTLSVIQLCFFLFLGPLKNIMLVVFPSIEKYLVIINSYNVVPTLTCNYILAFLITSIIFLIGLILLYFAFNRNLLAPIIYLASLASRFIIGLSPTIFVSGARTAFFAYIGIIILIFMLMKSLDDNKIKSNIKYAITSIAILNVLNILYTLIIIKGL